MNRNFRFPGAVLVAASACLAAPPTLELFQRIDQEDGTSKLIFLPNPRKAAVNYAESPDGRRGLPLHARLWLAHPVEGREKTFDIAHVYICHPADRRRDCSTPSDAEGDPIKADTVEAILPTGAVTALLNYTAPHAEGRRFEAVIEIKNLSIAGEATTVTSVVPSVVQMIYDPTESAFEEGEIVFRALYVPTDLAVRFADAVNWKLNGKKVVCCVKTAALPWYRFCSGAVEPAKQEGRVVLEFDIDGNQVYSVERRPTAPRYFSRALQFRSDAVTVSRDLPVFTRFNYTHNRGEDGSKENVFALEAAFNYDEKLKAPSRVVNPVGHLYMSPGFYINMSTNAFVDNTNTIQWWLPIEYRWRRNPTCEAVGKCPERFQRRLLREITFGAGLRGEHSSEGQSQNLVVPIGSNFRFRKARINHWAFQFDQWLGVDLGRNTSESVLKVTDAISGEERRSLIKVPNDFIFRLVGTSKASLSLSDRVSITAQYEHRNLQREEQYLKVKKVKGFFTPDPEKDHFLANAKTSYSVKEPKFRTGPRQYLAVNFNYELSSYVDFSMQYARGELAPAFQYVNKFTVGIGFKFVGVAK